VKQRVLIVFFTALVFGAGFAARAWTEGDRALPPPPAAPGSEFVRSAATPAPTPDPKNNAKPTDRAKLIADIERLRPQIDAYRKRMDQIATEFDAALLPVLTPEQQAKYVAQQKKNAERRAQGEARDAADTGPLSDEQIFQLQQRPLWNVLWSVAIVWRLERLDHDFKLDDAQKAKARALLTQRREKFLALVDTTPPPSISLSQLASQTQKLADPAKAAK
jgi:hypothetical protein